jgi:type IV secretory pathway TrbL component
MVAIQLALVVPWSISIASMHLRVTQASHRRGSGSCSGAHASLPFLLAFFLVFLTSFLVLLAFFLILFCHIVLVAFFLILLFGIILFAFLSIILFEIILCRHRCR